MSLKGHINWVFCLKCFHWNSELGSVSRRELVEYTRWGPTILSLILTAGAGWWLPFSKHVLGLIGQSLFQGWKLHYLLLLLVIAWLQQLNRRRRSNYRSVGLENRFQVALLRTKQVKVRYRMHRLNQASDRRRALLIVQGICGSHNLCLILTWKTGKLRLQLTGGVWQSLRTHILVNKWWLINLEDAGLRLKLDLSAIVQTTQRRILRSVHSTLVIMNPSDIVCVL